MLPADQRISVRTTVLSAELELVDVYRTSLTDKESAVRIWSFLLVKANFLCCTASYNNAFYCNFIILGSRGKLSTPCLERERCIDTNTVCNSGICLCSSAHYEKYNVCSKYRIYQ